MSVKIRLARAGAKKAPFYRIVAADSRSPRDGRFIEILGRYNPRTHPSTIEMDVEKVKAWIAKGAQPSETVERLLAIAENPDSAVPETKQKVSKKAAARAKAEAAAAEAPSAEAAEEPPAAEAADEETAAEEAAEESPAEETAAQDEAPEAQADDEGPAEGTPADEPAEDE